ncbi:hypothetical protein GYH30_035011 [Glycine max]|uniref:Replication protein A 70 kDa DNA-binding subunit B/D first OB fold domain-containing protein n=2 Tax=Glycine subgen. Soja TaxID=1462606 RepID=K7LY43_SOYBN|nr:hypothetical protein GYH30_035011 [Glycine max]RZB70691.1 hypothetical protein D0Y65_035595 [Glycine soja]
MTNKYNSVAEINAEKKSWRIMVRVVRLWMVLDVLTNKQTSSNKIPFSMEMVLVDSKQTLIYKFEKTFQEGKVYPIQFFGVAENEGIYKTTYHKYKIVFQYSTKVALVDNASVPYSAYDFVHIRDIVCGGYDTDYLVENERNIRRSKINVILIEDDVFSIECTLFGPFVDELNAFLASRVVENVVVIIHLAKMNCFQDKIHLQNCICGTRVVFNAKCEEVKELATRMMESPPQGLSQIIDSIALTMSEDFLHNTTRKTIGGLKDCFEVTCFPIFGTVKYVVDDEKWYHINVCVIDESNSTTSVIFDQDATILFSKSCANMFETYMKKRIKVEKI